MKKGIKILCIVLSSVFIFLLLLPYAFNSKIEEIIRKEDAKKFNARIEFQNLNLSFIRDFPNIYISMNRPVIIGSSDFKGDTLLSAKKIVLSIGWNVLLGSRSLHFRKISAEWADLHLICNEGGNKNWNILKKETSRSDKSGEENSFIRSFKNISLKNTNIIYDDDSLDFHIEAKKSDFNFKGNLLENNTVLKLNMKSDSLSVKRKNIQYLSNVNFNSKFSVHAVNMKNNLFEIGENKTDINSLSLNFGGWLRYVKGRGWLVDVKLNRTQNQFKNLLSLIPAIYAKDFDDVDADGNVYLNAYAKGYYTSSEVPAFNSRLIVSKASFQYESMSRSVDNINIDAGISNRGGSFDNTRIDIPKFHLVMAGTPMDIKLHIYNPLTDPYIDLAASGKLYLNRVKEVYPMKDGSKLTGLFKADFKVNTRLSYIQKKRFDKVVSSGTMSMKNFSYETGNKKLVNVKNASFSFYPEYVLLDDFSAVSGSSDLSGSGKLFNLFPYLFDKGIVKGDLSLHSENFNIDDFKSRMKPSEEESSSSVDRFELPHNLNLSFDASVGNSKIGNMDVQGLSGFFHMNNGRLQFENLKMNALGGVLNMSGYYLDSLPDCIPEFYSNMTLGNVSVEKVFSSFASVRKLAPFLKNAVGTFSSTLSVDSKLINGLVSDINSMKMEGWITSDNFSIENEPVLNAISGLIGNNDLFKSKINSMVIPFSVSVGEISTSGGSVNFEHGVSLNMKGTTNRYGELNYILKLGLPPNMLSGGVLSNENLGLEGTFDHPKTALLKNYNRGVGIGNRPNP